MGIRMWLAHGIDGDRDRDAAGSPSDPSKSLARTWEADPAEAETGEAHANDPHPSG